MAVHVETRFWPIVYARLEGEVTEADVASMATAFDRVFARASTFATVADLRHVLGVAGAKERKAIADWLQTIEPQMKAYCVGSSNLMRSSLIRGALTAIYWIFTPPVPQQQPGRPDDATRWCAERLAEAGIDAEATARQLTEHIERLDDGARAALAK